MAPLHRQLDELTLKMASIEKTAPAFDGAKFNSKGFCIVHPDIRLCQLLIADDGKYKVVQKTCSKCDIDSLVTELRAVKTNPHAPPKKPSAKKYDRHASNSNSSSSNGNTANSGVNSSVNSGGNSSSSTGSNSGGNSSGNTSSSSNSGGNASGQERSRPSRPRAGRATRRSPRAPDVSRSLSPAPRMRRRGRPLSPTRHAAKHRPRTLSPSVDNAKQSPPAKPDSGQKDASKPRPDHAAKHAASAAARQEALFNGEGCCRVHPAVRLAKKSHKGGWKILSDACPLCTGTKPAAKPKKSSKSPTALRDKKSTKSTSTAKKSDRIADPSDSSSSLSPVQHAKPALSSSYTQPTNQAILKKIADIYPEDKLMSEQTVGRIFLSVCERLNASMTDGSLDAAVKRSNIHAASAPSSPKPKKREPAKLDARLIEQSLALNYERSRRQ